MVGLATVISALALDTLVTVPVPAPPSAKSCNATDKAVCVEVTGLVTKVALDTTAGKPVAVSCTNWFAPLNVLPWAVIAVCKIPEATY